MKMESTICLISKCTVEITFAYETVISLTDVITLTILVVNLSSYVIYI